MEKISWKALEYKKKERTTDWYWAVILITISMMAISIIFKDYLFALLLLVSISTIIIMSIKDPLAINISIDKRGVLVDKDLYPFTNLESFWIDTIDKNNPKIILKSQKTIMPPIIIPIENYNYMDIRDILLEFLPEVEMNEPLSHKIMDKLGF